MSERILFDESAALTKVGQRIKTLVEFSGVPRGTLGEVTRADKRAVRATPWRFSGSCRSVARSRS